MNSARSLQTHADKKTQYEFWLTPSHTHQKKYFVYFKKKDAYVQ